MVSRGVAIDVVDLLEPVKVDGIERAWRSSGHGFLSLSRKKRKRLAAPVSASRQSALRSMMAMVVMRSVASWIVPSMKIGFPSASRTYQAFSVIQIFCPRAVAIDLRDKILDPAFLAHQTLELVAAPGIHIPGAVGARHRMDIFGFVLVAIKHGERRIAAHRGGALSSWSR